MGYLTVDRAAIRANLKAHKYAYGLIALLAVANLPVLPPLVRDWASDGNYSHGFLIIPISIWLFWRKRHDLSFPARPSTAGVVLFIFGCLCLILGTAAGELFTIRTSLVIILTGISLSYLGRENFRKVWFPFFFLLFMIPIPATIYYSLTLPLQLFASKVTVAALHVISIPSLQRGNIIQLPNYRLEVLEACSGLRSLVTLMALGALYGNLSMPGKVRPIVLFIATIPIAIATNIFRIFITAVAAYAISTEIAEGFLHELSGFLVFGSALILTLILGALLKWRRKRS
jgi:exosortase